MTGVQTCALPISRGTEPPPRDPGTEAPLDLEAPGSVLRGGAWIGYLERAAVAGTRSDAGEDGGLLRRAGRSLASLEEELRQDPSRPGHPSEPEVGSPCAAAESDAAWTTAARSREDESRSAPIPRSAADNEEVVAEGLAV